MGVALVLHHVAGELESQAPSSVSLPRSRPKIQAANESVSWGEVKRIRAGGHAESFFSYAASYHSVGKRARRGRWSPSRSEARRG
jgi:hypothetical protein